MVALICSATILVLTKSPKMIAGLAMASGWYCLAHKNHEAGFRFGGFGMGCTRPLANEASAVTAYPGNDTMPHSWKRGYIWLSNTQPPPTMAKVSVQACSVAAGTLNSLPSRSTISMGRPRTPPWALHQPAKASAASSISTVSPGAAS